MTKNIITFKAKFLVIKTGTSSNLLAALSFQMKLMRLGYILNEEALNALATNTEEYMSSLFAELAELILIEKGGMENNTPLFPGFPREVIEASQGKIFLKKVQSYFGIGNWGKKDDTFKYSEIESGTYEVIYLGSEEKFLSLFKEIAESPIPISKWDEKVLKWFLEESKKELPKLYTVKIKDILAMLVLHNFPVKCAHPLDVLRVALVLSGQSASILPIPKKVAVTRFSKVVEPSRDSFKFKKFSRFERKYILSLLEATSPTGTDLAEKRDRWIRLGEIIHPGEYATRFPKSFKAFEAIRNTKVQSIDGKIEDALAKDFAQGVAFLSNFPGKLIRKFDALFRNQTPENKKILIKTLSNVGRKATSKVLLEFQNHIEGRLETAPKNRRKLTLKHTKKAIFAQNVMGPLLATEIDAVKEAIWEAIKGRISTMPALGKVWIDPDLFSFSMPKSLKMLDSSLRPISQGTPIPLESKSPKVIRAFIHWFNDGTAPSGCDIDLSGILANDDFTKTDFVGWNGGYAIKDVATYSGDVMDRMGACAEYVDIDISGAYAKGFRWAIFDIRDFRSNPNGFKDYKQAYFGVMEREFPEANNLWTPDTIKISHTIESIDTSNIVGVFDLKKKCYYIINISSVGKTALGDMRIIKTIVKSIVSAPKFSIGHFLTWHMEARGEKAISKEKADIVFQATDFIEYKNILKFFP